VLGRSPLPAEVATCKTYLANADIASRESMLRALLNHNDFVTIR
jgi:hypothetical protein